MRWPWTTPTPPPARLEDLHELDTRSATFSISDPNLLEYFNVGGPRNFSGVTVTETEAMGISSVWRAVDLISSTIASLKSGAVEHHDNGTRERVDSWLDDPCPMLGLTRFEFWRLVVRHILLHGNAYLFNIRDGAGRMVGLHPIHPNLVTVEWDPRARVKLYKITQDEGGTEEYTDFDVTHIMGQSVDGLVGQSVITVARNSMGVTIAAERATGGMFSDGAMVAGIITPEDRLDPDQAEEISRAIRSRVTGYENAGRIPVINRGVKFQQLATSYADAQFLESRQFQVEEVARWFGVPPHLLMQTEKQTSWGTGVAEQNRGLGRTVLGPIVEGISQRISRLLPTVRHLEFDFASLEKPDAETEIDLLLRQVAGGLMTVNEARAIRNMTPHPDGDTLYQPAGGVGRADEEPEPDPEPSPRGDNETEEVPA